MARRLDARLEASVSTAMRVAADSPGPSNHCRLGSFLNQINCRRAYCRFSRAISSRVAPRRARRADARAPAGRRARRTGARFPERRAPAGRGSRRAARARTARRRAARRVPPSAPPGAAARWPTTSHPGERRRGSAKCAVSGRPVRKYTSSARIDPLQVARLDPLGRRGSTRRSMRCRTLAAAPRGDRARAARASARRGSGPGNSPRVSAR